MKQNPGHYIVSEIDALPQLDAAPSPEVKGASSLLGKRPLAE
jgi:hypothetical protein